MAETPRGKIAILAAPDRALADDECGTPVAGVVTTCAALTYGTGIRYDSLPGEDLTVVIEEDVAVAGAVSVNGKNAITVQAKAGSTITTADADGITANANGDVSVVSASIETTGGYAYGVLVHSYGRERDGGQRHDHHLRGQSGWHLRICPSESGGDQRQRHHLGK